MSESEPIVKYIKTVEQIESIVEPNREKIKTLNKHKKQYENNIIELLNTKNGNTIFTNNTKGDKIKLEKYNCKNSFKIRND